MISDSLLDTLVGPGASKFTAAEIPDCSGPEISKESSHWVANFFLNCLVGPKFLPPMDAYAYNFLRRAQFAFAEHALARESTMRYLQSGRRSVKPYVASLHHWEAFLGQAWHAYGILIKAWNGTAFTRGDGSVEERLNALYNQMKHVESRIHCGQMPEGGNVPVWLENAGLRSTDTHLSFAETEQILRDIGKYADILSDPRTAGERLRLMDEQTATPSAHSPSSSAASS